VYFLFKNVASNCRAPNDWRCWQLGGPGLGLGAEKTSSLKMMRNLAGPVHAVQDAFWIITSNYTGGVVKK
jgi:hypothetical protein